MISITEEIKKKSEFFYNDIILCSVKNISFIH